MSPKASFGILGTLVASVGVIWGGETSAQEKEKRAPIITETSAATKERILKHLGTNTQGWSETESNNFRIFLKDVPISSDEVARIAENTRDAMRQKWMGSIGEDWKLKCDIRIYPHKKMFADWTGDHMDNPGLTKTRMEGGRVIQREIHLQHRWTTLTHLLPHEVTHVALSDAYEGQYPPRWKEEGVAVLSEPAAQTDAFQKQMIAMRREGLLFPLRKVLEANDYPGLDRKSINAFYSQSVAVTNFLCTRKDPSVLRAFANDASLNGYDKALEKYYGYKTVEELERDLEKSLGITGIK